MLLEALRLYAGGRDYDLFSYVLARVVVVVVRLGSGGSVAVLLWYAVAFLRCAGSGGFPDICALFIPIRLRRFHSDLSPLVPVTFVLSSVSAGGCDFFPLFSAGGYFSW